MLVLVLTTVFLVMLPAIALATDMPAEATFKIDLTTVFVALLNVIGMVVAKYAIPWIKSKTTEAERLKMLRAVNVAVYAEEQTLGAAFSKG